MRVIINKAPLNISVELNKNESNNQKGTLKYLQMLIGQFLHYLYDNRYLQGSLINWRKNHIYRLNAMISSVHNLTLAQYYTFFSLRDEIHGFFIYS